MNNSKTTIDIDQLYDDEQESEGLNLQAVISLIRIKWKQALLFGCIGLAIAFVYLRYATPIYESKAKILVKDDNKASARGEMEMLQTLGILPGTSNVNNELEIIKSYSLSSQVVKELSLNIALYSTTHAIKRKEFYVNNLPFGIRQTITDNKLYDKLTEESFLLTQYGNTVTLVGRESNSGYKGTIGDRIELPGIILQLVPKQGVAPLDEPLELEFHSIRSITGGYNNAVAASIPNKQVSVIDLTVENSIPQRGEDLLNTLIFRFIQNGINDRNAISDSTIAFINARLANVETDLSALEGEIQDFKQRNEIVNIAEQASALIGDVSGLTKSEANIEVEASVVNSLLAFMQQTDQDPKIIAASLSVNNPGLISLIEKYNTLLLERERNLMSVTEGNPLIQNIDTQLGALRTNIRNGLQSQKQSLMASLSTVKRRTGSIESSMKTVPGKERTSIEFGRQQAIKQELFVFLLQKREEAALTKSSTISNVRVIDNACTTRPVSPRKNIIYLAALMLGVAAPFGWAIAATMLNNKIGSRKDIIDHTAAPILGEIGHYDAKENEPFVIDEKSSSSLSEQFRILRSNLRFSLGGNGHNTVLVTSNIPGEGKTFISMNLGASIALSGKRTVLIGMDLRKPQITKRLGVDKSVGVSDVLIGAVTLDEALIAVEGIDNYFILPAGTLPPNPSELLMSPATQGLFAMLRERFDYLIVDSAPLMVADATILSEHADSTLLITRVGHTFKDNIKQIEQLRRDKRLPNMGIVANDINMEYDGAYYYYGYNYGYYGYHGYYGEGEEKGKKKRKKRIRN